MTEPSPTKGARYEDDALTKYRLAARCDWPTLPTAQAMQQDPKQLSKLLYGAHDGPHDSAKIEWWYINGHFGEDEHLSVFAAFFRLSVDGVPGAYAHATNWALVDTKAKTYRTFSLLDPATPSVLSAMIATNEYHGDAFVLKALKELFDAGRVLKPDAMMAALASVSACGAPLALDFGGNVFRVVSTDDEGMPTYELLLRDESTKTSVSLTIRPRLPPALSGKDGVVSTGHWQDDMFYYFSPLCDVVTGTFSEGTSVTNVSGGRFWVDHEFGGCKAETLEDAKRIRTGGSVVDYAWEWVAVQLDNASHDAVSVTVLKDTAKGGVVTDLFAVYQDGSTGAFYRYDKGVSFASVAASRWKSSVTGMTFPTEWTVTVPHNGGVTLAIKADIAAQEFITLPGKPSYWEGRASVRGTTAAVGGQPVDVTGVGFVECHGEKSLHEVSAAYGMMHMMLCTPLESMPLGPQVDVPVATTAATTMVEQASMMVQLTTGKAIPDNHKVLLKALMAAYAVAHHRPHTPTDAPVVAGALAALEAQWSTHNDVNGAWDFPTLVLRAFTLRTLQHIHTHQCAWMHEVASPPPVAAIPAQSTSAHADSTQLLRVPTDQELTTPATPEQLKLLEKLASGMWMVDKSKPRGNIGDFLAAQGVGVMARTLCASVTPDLKTALNGDILETDIITAISTTKSVVQLNGKEWQWESFGRGTLTSQGCVRSGTNNGFCVITVVTPVAKGEVELKWVIVRDDGTMEEVLHLVPSLAEGGAPRATFTQWFKHK